MALLMALSSLLILAYICNKLYIAFLKPGVSGIPGPLLAKFSDLYTMYLSYRNIMSPTLQDLHGLHGSVVRLGPNRFSLVDPADLDQVYGSKHEMPKSDQMGIMSNVVRGQVVEGIIGTQSKSLHGVLRRPIASLYSLTNIMQYQPIVDDAIKVFASRLEEGFVSTGRACPIDIWFQLFAFDVITAVTTSTRHGFLDEGGDVDGMLKELNDNNVYKGLVLHAPWVDYLLLKNAVSRTLFNPQMKIISRTASIVASRMSSISTSGIDDNHDMLSKLIEIHQQRPEEIPARRLTSSIIYYCLKSPDGVVCRRLQKEIDDADLKMPSPLSDAMHLDYLDSVLKESMRCHFIAPMTLEREVVDGPLQLADGRKLPKGSYVGSSGAVVHFDKHIFGEDADTFNPDRWLQSSSESLEAYTQRLHNMRAVDMGWGRGSRVCLGKNIALMEIYKLIATMFGLFDMELVHPDKEWRITETLFRSQSDMDVKIRWRPGKSLASLS